ncbi:MAG: hypothetical protein H7Y38_05120 [Armatimonadetes bacterium]|nr:hypothetical protein [Armatimonadota bacterium]
MAENDEETWNHPQWGMFVWDEYAWLSDVVAPGFDIFTYDTRNGNALLQGSVYEVGFESDEGEPPSPEVVAVVEKVVARSSAIADAVVTALWNDFAGDPPKSGMWWHGDLESVSEGIEPPPTAPGDLPALLRLNRIIARDRDYGTGTPVVELSFHAAFEEEHGVGILTDGEIILGTGYCYDVSPYGTTYGDGDG